MNEEVQRRNVEKAARAVATIAREHQTIVTHGNGPQVGLLALESEAYREVQPFGLDVLGAESQGMIGFLIEQALRNVLGHGALVTLLTSVLVDRNDPAFTRPTKPIGPLYSKAVAARLAAEKGWRVTPDRGGYRRVVPSPKPLQILELEAIKVLIEAGILVICGGGGGVPVVANADGALEGVEGVVDKDLTSCLLARAIEADFLLLLTDVAAVEADWKTEAAKPIHEITVSDLSRVAFEPGSMGPKVEAACDFVTQTGRTAGIGALADAPEILAGRKGTIVRP